MKLLILGSDGMVGHVVSLYMEEKGHEIKEYGENHPVLSEYSALEEEIRTGSFDAVINCSAVINQDAEANKVNAIKVNSLLPHFLESVTAGTKTVVVHRSTDCIFSGEKGNYTLEDWPDGRSFYARTKAIGELNNEKDITIRTSLVGPETDKNGSGLFNWFYNQQGEMNGFANAIWTGLTTIEFAGAVEYLLNNRKHGIFQIVPARPISKYELLLLFEKYYPGNRIVNKIENKRIDKSLVTDCGEYKVPDYETQIAKMKQWINNHKDIYRYE